MKDVEERLQEISKGADELLHDIIMENKETASYVVMTSANELHCTMGCGGEVENILMLLARGEALLMAKANEDTVKVDVVFEMVKEWAKQAYRELIKRSSTGGGTLN